MGFWDWWNERFAPEPRMQIVAHLHTDNFLEEADVISAPLDAEHTYELSLQFEEPVRDGNDIYCLNFRDPHGSIIGSIELASGSSATRTPLPGRDTNGAKYDILTVNSDGGVLYTDTVTITKEPIE